MNDIPDNFYRMSIKALITNNNNGKLLLSKNIKGQWEIPGGGLDFGEMPVDCLERELKEEMGLKVSKIESRPKYFVTIQDDNGVWKAMVVYQVEVDNLKFTKSDECQEVKFFTKEEALKENCHPMTIGFLEQM